MPFALSHQTLLRLCNQNAFAIPEGMMIFFGLRGAAPINEDDNTFRERHFLGLREVDYKKPCCTIGQWLPQEGKLAVFLGSTVPTLGYVEQAMAAGGEGANQMMPGFYTDYMKGQHHQGTPKAYDAFRQTRPHPVRRTVGNEDFDNLDEVSFGIQSDNIHAATSYNRLNGEDYSSAGCQVIVGYPKVPAKPASVQTGPWGPFHDNAYAIAQTNFPYFLLLGKDGQKAASEAPSSIFPRLRFGSNGALVAQLQEKLMAKGLFAQPVNSLFDYSTFQAVVKHQEQAMGRGEADGVVGRVTAESLGMDWRGQSV